MKPSGSSVLDKRESKCDTGGSKRNRESTRSSLKYSDSRENGNYDFYKKILVGLEGAALQSRLPFEKMTPAEEEFFSEIMKNDPIAQRTFLNIRNKILQIWIQNPKQQLTIENSLQDMEPPFNNEPQLVKKIHTYLERHGFINFGIFKRFKPIPTKKLVKVIVIGAGISGLVVAQQLKQFGMDAIVLEARDRVGGRIATFRKSNFIADMGAMVVEGVWGNPITILSRQTGMEMMPIRQTCPLYDAGGSTISMLKDDLLECEFNKLLECASYISHQLDSICTEKNTMSLGQTLEWIIKHQEKHVKENQIKHLKNILEFQKNIINNQNKSIKLLERIQKLKNAHIHLIKNRPNKTTGDNDQSYIEHEFKIKLTYYEWKNAWKEFKTLKQCEENYTAELIELEKESPSDIYLSLKDRQILDWHFANLEFVTAAPLTDLSLKHWEQSDNYEFIGNHKTVRNGYSCFPIALTEGLDVRLNSAVKTIKYYSEGVEIITESSKSNNSTNYTADLVVCTLPLGVLKAATSPMLSSINQMNTVSFDPPLPEWKQTAIQRLGFGNLNKVLLCFDKIFWDPNSNLFGHIGATTKSRGEFFLFWNIPQSSVLLALISGQSATILENASDEIIVGRCITVLKDIFGNTSVPQPKETLVTRWQSDPWARGSHSFVAVGSSDSDYDLLAAPVTPQNPNDSTEHECKGMPRLFFAGEHTIRNYPATVHGAFLSGLREAGRIADNFLDFPEKIV